MKNRGFTIVEVVVSLAILMILSGVALWHFSAATKEEALKKDRQGLIALLNEARSLSMASKDATSYGVHVEESKAELFSGDVYSPNPSNRVHNFHSAVHVLSFSLEGGGSDIVFSRLTGSTSNYGSIALSLKDDTTFLLVVSIKNTGVIE